jgi:nickel transport protein
LAEKFMTSLNFKKYGFAPLFSALAILAVMAFSPKELLAHGVYIFGWGEGDQICTDSYFTRTDKVQGGTVKITRDGQVLASALTNENGEVCLPRPKVQGDLLLVVEAGEGHRAEFTLRAEDLPALENGAAASSAGAGSAPPASSAAAQATDSNSAPASNAQEGASTGVTSASLDSLRSMIREELRSQLSPINRALAQAQNAGAGPPGLREIVGGLGWVIGIFGAFAFGLGRRGANPSQKAKG